MGKKLVSFLQDQGYTCLILTANKSQKKQEHIFHWNPSEGIIDEHCLDGVSIIIHLAGAGIADRRWTNSYKQLILDSRVKGAELLYNLAKKKNLYPEHFISASGSGIYASGAGLPLDEQGVFGKGFLTDVCKRWEAAAFQFGQLGTQVSVVRTAVVLAAEGGFLKPFNLAMKFRMLPVFGKKTQHLSWIHLEDLVAIYGHLVMDEEYRGVFNASAPETITQFQFLRILSQVRAHRCLYPVLPAFAVKLIFGAQSELLLGDQQVYPAKLLQHGFVFKFPTLKEALKQIYAKQ